MAHETDDLHNTDSISRTDRWTAAIGFWFRARRMKCARNSEILELLSLNERLLKDTGLSRSQLVGELGYDPCELPIPFGAAVYRRPFLSAGHGRNSNHAERYRLFIR